MIPRSKRRNKELFSVLWCKRLTETKPGSACDFRGERENPKVACCRDLRLKSHGGTGAAEPNHGQVKFPRLSSSIPHLTPKQSHLMPRQRPRPQAKPHPQLRHCGKAPGAAELPRPPGWEAWAPLSPPTKEQRTTYCASCGVFPPTITPF